MAQPYCRSGTGALPSKKGVRPDLSLSGARVPFISSAATQPLAASSATRCGVQSGRDRLHASVRITSARNAVPPIGRGHIDRRNEGPAKKQGPTHAPIGVCYDLERTDVTPITVLRSRCFDRSGHDVR
jgi:hypothetical protein